MKTMRSIDLANWMLKHWVLGPYDESLTGDLLEELRSGRSVGWYWRQAIAAIAVSLSNRFHTYVSHRRFLSAGVCSISHCGRPLWGVKRYTRLCSEWQCTTCPTPPP